MGDEPLAKRLEATAAVVGIAAPASPDVDRHARTLLAEAIRYMAAEVRPP
jgi:hypothetical protein